MNERYERIYAVVRSIPRGHVSTYGDVAAFAELEGHARQVGYALHALPERSRVPWHRVVNARGEISPRSSGDSHELQLLILRGEGVAVENGRVDLKLHRWKRERPPHELP